MCVQDAIEEVKREATEFWSILADVTQARPHLQAVSLNIPPRSFLKCRFLSQVLPRLLPVLLSNMAYSEFDDVDEVFSTPLCGFPNG